MTPYALRELTWTLVTEDRINSNIAASPRFTRLNFQGLLRLALHRNTRP